MNGMVIVALVGVVAVVALIAAALYRRRQTLVQDYRAMFVIGLVLTPLGVKNLGLLAAGLPLLGAGWRNKHLWGKHTRWADFPPQLKRLKLAAFGALGAFALSVLFLVV